jgi:hypothetical protein
MMFINDDVLHYDHAFCSIMSRLQLYAHDIKKKTNPNKHTIKC